MSLQRFLRNERGATAIEYAVIAALIFMAIIVAMQPIGATLSGTFGHVSDTMNSATAG